MSGFGVPKSEPSGFEAYVCGATISIEFICAFSEAMALFVAVTYKRACGDVCGTVSADTYENGLKTNTRSKAIVSVFGKTVRQEKVLDRMHECLMCTHCSICLRASLPNSVYCTQSTISKA